MGNARDSAIWSHPPPRWPVGPAALGRTRLPKEKKPTPGPREVRAEESSARGCWFRAQACPSRLSPSACSLSGSKKLAARRLLKGPPLLRQPRHDCTPLRPAKLLCLDHPHMSTNPAPSGTSSVRPVSSVGTLPPGSHPRFHNRLPGQKPNCKMACGPPFCPRRGPTLCWGRGEKEQRNQFSEREEQHKHNDSS